jgi:leader peptidase (prepilin peptidase)/N-methyltransferase
LVAGIGALLGVVALPFILTGAALLGLALALLDRLRGRAVSATTALPFGALLAGMALIMVMIGPDWLALVR